MADLIASSASSEQCTVRSLVSQASLKVLEIRVREVWDNAHLTGGKHNSFAISVFLTCPACSTDMPFTRSVMYEDEAMAEPQPNVLNLTSLMMPSESEHQRGLIATGHPSDRECKIDGYSKDEVRRSENDGS